jgi:hypothetical protein
VKNEFNEINGKFNNLKEKVNESGDRALEITQK